MDRTERDYARLLLLFWEEGIRPKKAGPVLAMANDVLGQWLRPQTKELSVITAWEAHVGVFDDIANEGEDADRPHALRFAISMGESGARIAGGSLGKLDKATPGLGQAVLYWIEQSGYRTIEVMTPEIAGHIAEYLWWQGESDEAEWRQMLMDQGLEPEEIDGYTGPEKFVKAFPDWALTTKKPALAKLAPKSRKGKQILEILQEMEASGNEQLLPGLMPEGYDRMYWGTYLGWSRECPMFRLLDDHFQMAYQGDGASDLNGYEIIPMEAKAFKAWKTRMEKGFRLLGLLDRLLLLTTEEY